MDYDEHDAGFYIVGDIVRSNWRDVAYCCAEVQVGILRGARDR